MKVSELIVQLQNMDPDIEVCLRLPSGDYWKTELAVPARDVSDEYVSWKEYHRCYATISDYRESEGDPEHPDKYVALIG